MLLCGLICGIIAVAGYYLSISLLFFGIIIAIALAYFIFIGKNPRYIFIGLLVLVMLLSTVHSYSQVHKTENYADKTERLQFIVCDITYESPEYAKAEIEIKNGKLKGKAATVLYYEPLEIGKSYIADIKFKEIPKEYKLLNYSNNIFLNGSLSNIEAWDVPQDFVLIYAEKTRNYIKDISFKYLGYDEAATLCALLFGDGDYFTDEFYSNVKGAGVSHVMVVSGMHLAIIAGFFTMFADKFVYNKYLKAFLLIIIVILLTTICGFTMSMKRAGITYIIMAIAILINRKSTPSNTIGAALTLILITSPFAIFNVALQLSFLSTFGILAVALPVMDYIKRKEMIKSVVLLFIADSVILSLSALILTLPVVIYIFGYISTVCLIANLLISNIVTITICLAVVGLITGLFSDFLTAVVMMPCNGLLKYINYVINTLGGWGFSTFSVPQFCTVFAIFLILLLFWLLLACKKRNNVIKLNIIEAKILKEGGKKVKWR